jgi:hypothetical protein
MYNAQAPLQVCLNLRLGRHVHDNASLRPGTEMPFRAADCLQLQALSSFEFGVGLLLGTWSTRKFPSH